MNITSKFVWGKDSTKYLNTIRQSPRRLLLGIAIMLISSVLGGIVISSESKTFTALATANDVAPGVAISRADLTEVQLPASAAGSQWLLPEEVGEGLVLNHGVSAGTIVQKSDLADVSPPGDHLGISLDSGYVPTGLEVGSEISLWSVDPQREAGYLTDAVVLKVSQDENSQSTYLAVRINQQATALVLQQAAVGAIRVVIST
ncbi:MAG: hypothetical protein RIS75_1237 [Actinomycetota bacterium]